MQRSLHTGCVFDSKVAASVKGTSPFLLNRFLCILGALFILSSGQSWATVVYVLQTAPGATATDPTTGSTGPVDARVQLTIDTDHMHIVLLNALTTTSQLGDISNINGFGLNIQQTINVAINPGGLTSGSIVRTINRDGTFADAGYQTTNWSVDTLASQNYNFFLDGRTKPPSIFPAETLVFMPNKNSTTYNVNGSIAGSGAHNPFYATNSLNYSDPLNPQWDIQFAPNSGINDRITIKGAGFAFGTSTTVFAVAGEISYISTPEPASIALFVAGLLIIVAATVRSRKRISGAR